MIRAVLGWAATKTGSTVLRLKVVLDGLGLIAAAVVAYFVRFEGLPPEPYLTQMGVVVPALVVCRLLSFWGSGVYRTSWRLFGLPEAMRLLRPAMLITLVLLGWRWVGTWIPERVWVVPLGVIVLEGFSSLLITLGIRTGTRIAEEGHRRALLRRTLSAAPKRALLVGAGRGGRMAARELRDRPDTGYHVVGLLDDDPRRHGQVIEGFPVLGPTTDASTWAARTEADCFILTMPSVDRTRVREVVERCSEAGLPVRTVPGFYEVLGERVEVNAIRPLRIEDLLGRRVLGFSTRDWDELRAAFSNRRILVTGAGGSIGGELCRQLARLDPASLVLLENVENNLFEIEQQLRGLTDRAIPCLADIRDPEELARVFEEHRPQVVFHAAAYKHVPMMERYPLAAIDNNVLGTANLVAQARATGVERFLFISTDKAVRPTNIMGASKRIAELIVHEARGSGRTNFRCVRFGNVLGSKGSVLHTFQRQIEAGGPVTVTDPDITRYFMTIPEAVRLVLRAAGCRTDAATFVLDMGEPVRIADMAREMIRLHGLSTEEISVRFVGLRPGEKLHEELVRPQERSVPSEVEGVLAIDEERSGETRSSTSVEKWLNELRRVVSERDVDALRWILGEAADYRPLAATPLREAAPQPAYDLPPERPSVVAP